MKNIIALLLVPLAITGCTSTYKMEVLKSPAGKLQRSYSVIIKPPQNGRYSGTSYAGSGRMTANAFKNGFLEYASDVKLVSEKHSLNDFSNLKNIYYVEPQILHWEERATEWSGKPDRIEVKVNLYETDSKDHLSSVILTGKSKWLTFGGDHPQDLLPGSIEDYLQALY